MIAQKISSMVMRTIEATSIAVVKNRKRLIVGLLVVVIGATGLFMYRIWRGYKNESAQYALGNLLESYDNAMADDKVDLDDVLKQFQQEYEKHDSSDIAPYFLGYQVDMLIQQNKEDDARALLDTVIMKLGSSSLASLYKMKRALMKLDSTDESVQHEGKNELIALAHDKNNQFNDSALFYLGRYYWSVDEIALARQEWQTLLDEQSERTLIQSPWVVLAKKYLAVIIV